MKKNNGQTGLNMYHMRDLRKKLLNVNLLTRQNKVNLTATRMGFEPMRAEHNGLAVHHLNHLATSSLMVSF